MISVDGVSSGSYFARAFSNEGGTSHDDESYHSQLGLRRGLTVDVRGR
jgi:hypothetical protein